MFCKGGQVDGVKRFQNTPHTLQPCISVMVNIIFYTCHTTANINNGHAGVFTYLLLLQAQHDRNKGYVRYQQSLVKDNTNLMRDGDNIRHTDVHRGARYRRSQYVFLLIIKSKIYSYYSKSTDKPIASKVIHRPHFSIEHLDSSLNRTVR